MSRSVGMAPQHPAAYLRISKDDENLGEGVNRQRDDVLALSRRLGWPEPVFYIDNDRSAYKESVVREDWQRLLVDLKAGTVDGLLAYNLDRVVRQPAELETLIKLVEGRVPTHAATGVLDLSNDAGVTMARMMVGFANLESRSIGRRVKRKALDTAERGLPAGGRRPFGFEADKVTHRMAEVDIIREMSRRVRAGESMGSLRDDLNARGVRPPAAATWSSVSIKTILLAPRLAGIRALRGVEMAKASWEPVLPEEEWRQVVAILTGPGRSRPAGWNARKHLLSGIAICGIPGCGRPLRVKSTSHAGLRYACQGRGEGGCSGVSRDAAALDEAVVEWLMHRIETVTLKATPERDPSEDVIRKLQKRIDDLDRRYELEQVEDEDYFRHLKALRVAIKEAKGKAEKRFSAQTPDSNPRQAWANANLSQRRATLGIWVEAVVVGKVAKPSPKQRLELSTIRVLPK